MKPELLFQSTVPAGETCDIEVVATEAAAFNALLVDETFEKFDLCDFRINDETQLQDPTPLPAVVFKDTHGVRFVLDPIEKGSRVVLRIHNLGDTRPFSARLQVLPELPKPKLAGSGVMPEWPLGFHGKIAPGATAEFEAVPKEDFAPERLIVPSQRAPMLRIVNVLSDGKGTMPEPIDAILVTEVENQAALSDPAGHPWPRRVCEGLPVCKKGRPMTIVVQNTSESEQVFIAAILGTGYATK